MYGVNMYAQVRIDCLVEGLSMRQASQKYGVDRRTIKKMLGNAIYKGYCRTKEVKRPRIEGFTEFINDIIEKDKTSPKKQRHTIQRIYDRLRQEKGYQGCYNTVWNYLKEKRRIHKEMYVPLVHEAGEAQVDFGEAIAILGGEEVKIHFFVMDLPYSDAFYVKAYKSENTEAFCDGHVSSFNFFNGVPSNILYDNTRIAVTRILGEERQRTAMFSQLQSYYLFKDLFARVGRGNEKGNVENLVGFVRRNFMVPIPEFKNIELLNEYLEECCKKRQIVNGSIKEKLIEEQKVFLKLPDKPFLACNIQAGKVSSESLVRYQNNDYSVPVAYGYHNVLIKGYVDKVVICYKDKEIASHKRYYGKGKDIYNPLHYLPLIERKIRSFAQAAPLKNWELPSCFSTLRDKLESKYGKQGTRYYIQILRFLEDFQMNVVIQAVQYGLKHSLLDPISIKHLILQQIDKRPAPLDKKDYPAILAVECPKPDLSIYNDLITRRLPCLKAMYY